MEIEGYDAKQDNNLYHTLGGGRKHKMTHSRKHGKSVARKSHKKRTRKHRGGSPAPYITAGGKRKMTHRRKHGKSIARKSHKKRTHRRKHHRGGAAGIMGVINKAVVPFSLYKLQKRMQRMTKKARKHFSSRRK